MKEFGNNKRMFSNVGLVKDGRGPEFKEELIPGPLLECQGLVGMESKRAVQDELSAGCFSKRRHSPVFLSIEISVCFFLKFVTMHK